MEAIIGYGLGIWALGIALLIAPLMIWYHIGHSSRKLSRIIELLEKREGISAPRESELQNVQFINIKSPGAMAVTILMTTSLLIYILFMAWKLYRAG